MSNLTRIKNNQIIDSGIWANAKIIPGSIVGSLFSSNIVVTSDFVITGNLYVAGASTSLTVASTNTLVNDPLIVLNNAYAAGAIYDIGFVFERGTDVNQAFYWDESSDEFRLIATTEAGTTYGNIGAETSFANLRLGNLQAFYNVTATTIDASGFINTSGNVSASAVNGATLNVTGTSTLAAVNSSGLINTTGNISGAVVNTGALNVTGTSTLAAVNSSGLINTTGNISAAIINGGAINSTGFINTTGNVSASAVNGATLNVTGTSTLAAVNSSGFIQTTGNVSAAVVNSGQFNTSGNLSATEVSTQTLKASGLTSGRVVFTSTSGLLVDNAGITFTANTLTVGGAKPITINGTDATIATTGTNQDLILSPNGSGAINADTSQIINVTDPTSAQDAARKNYVDSQISSGVTNIQDDDTSVTIIDSTGTGRIEVTVDADLVGNITQDRTTLTNDVLVSNSTASTTTTSGALVVTGGVGVGGAATVGGQIKSTATTESTNTTSGAIITQGGVGIAKNLNVGGDTTITGNLTVNGVTTTVNSTTLDVDDLNITVAKGAASSAAADGAGLTVEGPSPSATLLYTHATTSWNFNKLVIGTGLNVTGNISGAVINAGALNATGTTTLVAVNSSGFINTTGNISASAVNGATLNVTGTSTLAAVNSSGFINTTGNISASAVNSATLNVTGTSTLAAVNSSGLINTTGNISAAIINGGAINSTGFINTTGNISGAVVNTGALNVTGTSTLAAVNSSGLINTTGNVSASTVNAAQFNTTGNVLATAGVFNALTVNGALAATGNVIGGLGQFAAINSTPIGNATPSTGAFTDLRATGTVYANATTDSTTLTTGALIVAGGAAVSKSMFVGEGMRINSTQSAETFHVLGQGTNNSLIYADLAKNAIVFGGANAAVQDGAVVKFNSTGAIVVPVGTTAERPGSTGNTNVQGMLRFNTTTSLLEFFDGSSFTAAGSVFTVIATNTFSGNGVQTAFTLSSSSTTAATLVMVNGVVQIPTTAYSVSGTTLTFTEAPASGDAIDARTLTTTSTVSAVSSGNGFNNFDVATAPYANITAGTSAATVRVSVDGSTGKVTFTNDVLINGQLTVLGDSSGNINIGNETGDRLQLRGKTVYDQTAINVPNTNLKELDSYSTAAFTTARYTVQIKNGSSVSAAELIVSHDTATANIATYAVLSTVPGTFQANISSGTVRLFYTPDNAQNANIKLLTTYIV